MWQSQKAAPDPVVGRSTSDNETQGKTMRSYHRYTAQQELPSKILRDASWDSHGQLSFCDEGCNEDGICMLDVVRCSFGIHDGDTVQNALSGKLDYLTGESVERLQQYLDALARDIKQGTDDEYDVLEVIVDTNNVWSKADEAHLNDTSLFNAHDLFETVEKALGYNQADYI